MKPLALILILAWLAAPIAKGDPNPVEELFKQADAANREKRFDDAIRLYERVVDEHPEGAGMSWFQTQKNIAVTLAKKGDLAEAAKAAHLCVDGAPDLGTFDEAVMLTANIISALDKNVERANQFLAFVKAAPGAGGANPLDAIGYPSLPDREHAFELMRQQAGDTSTASQVRAYTYLFTGKPVDALAQFADAFRKSSNPYEIQRTAQELGIVGLRAVRCSRVGLEKGIQFILFGPNGPDGKPNTPDDLADPFAKWLPNVPKPGEGGMASLSADDLAALRSARDGAKLYVEDPWVSRRIRDLSQVVLVRTSNALDDWGGPGQTEWYLQLVFVKDVDNPDYGLLTAAQAASRCRGLNLGGVYGVRKQIDAFCAAQGRKPTEGMKRTGDEFKATCDFLKQIRFQPIDLRPLNNPAVFQ